MVETRSACVPQTCLGTQHRLTALWRPPHDGKKYGAVAAKAYEDAITFCKREFKPKDRQVWLNGKNTIEDLKILIEDSIQRAPLAPYQGDGWKHRTMEAWRSLSATIDYYGKILDVLAQHHPEYVSLTWGAFKFLFLTTISYEELRCNIAENLVKIGKFLILIEGWTSLYQTDLIQGAAYTLYSHILTFCLKATTWVRKTRGFRILRAVAKPWAVDFEHCMQAIKDECKTISMCAQLALSAELRDMNFQQKLAALNVMQTNIPSAILEKKTGMLPKSPILSDLLQSLAPTTTSQQSLQVGKSLRDLRRARGGFTASIWASPCLRSWAEESRSAILYANGNSLVRDGAKDFVVDIIQLAMTIKVPVIWSFNALRKDNATPITATGTVKSLVQQLLLQLGEAATTSAMGTYSALQNPDAIDELLKIFITLTDMIPKLLIVVEVDDLSAPGIEELNKGLKSLVSRESSSIIKVIMVSYHRYQRTIESFVGNKDRTFSVAVDGRRGLRNSPSLVTLRTRSLGARGTLADGAGKLKPFLLRAMR